MAILLDRPPREFLESRKSPRKKFEIFQPWHRRNGSDFKNHIQVVFQMRRNDKRIPGMQSFTIRTDMSMLQVKNFVLKLIRKEEIKSL